MVFDKEDELRLASVIDVVKHDIFKGIEFAGIKSETILWLAENLKEMYATVKHYERCHPFNATDERKTIDTAKRLLMRKLGLKEDKAYMFIKKTAMNMGVSKFKVAMDIIEKEG